MNPFKHSWLVLVFLGAFAPANALAQDVQVVNMPITGWAFIGKINNVIWLGISQDGGATCRFWKQLETAPRLTRHLAITGTSGNDFIYFVDRSLRFCGHSVSALDVDGHTVIATGAAGHDILDGGNAAMMLVGDSGNDIVNSNTPVAVQMWGNDGNDQLFGRSSLTWMEGGDGDDIGCAQNASRVLNGMVGGANNTSSPGDRRCGLGSVNSDGWESLGCQAPCF